MNLEPNIRLANTFLPNMLIDSSDSKIYRNRNSKKSVAINTMFIYTNPM